MSVIYPQIKLNVLGRGDKLDDLVDKSDELQAGVKKNSFFFFIFFNFLMFFRQQLLKLQAEKFPGNFIGKIKK